MTPLQPTSPEGLPITATNGAGADIADRVRAITAGVLGIDPGRVDDGADIVSVLGASSLDLVELIMAIEDAFGIEISDSAAERIKTVGDIVAFVRGNLPAADRA